MNYKYIIIAFLVIFISCQNKQEKQNDLVVFENATEYNENTISFKDYRFAKLEYNMDAIIGEEIKMKIHNDDIYIMDMENQRVLLHFDGNGNFINKIGKVGRGPEEFLEMGDFCFSNDTINIMASNGELSIYRYLPDGDLIEILKTPHRVELSFETLPNGNYVVNPAYEDEDIHRLSIMDNKEKVISNFMPIKNKNWVNFQYPGVGISKTDDIIVFGDYYNDTIYNVTNNKIIPRYILDFGSYSNQSIDYESADNRRELLQKELDKGLWLIRKCYETKDYLLVEYWEYKGSGIKIRILVYNKTNGKKTTLNLDNKKSLRPNFMGLTKENEMVFIMYPFGDEFEEFKQLFPDAELPTLGETDNAMIMYCKL